MHHRASGQGFLTFFDPGDLLEIRDENPTQLEIQAVNSGSVRNIKQSVFHGSYQARVLLPLIIWDKCEVHESSFLKTGLFFLRR